jgi:RNA polymerase primary sigma factor
MLTRHAGTVNLYSWQDEALAAWGRPRRRGMIEAVTGSGKTHVGIAALAKLYDGNKRLSTLVVVPSIVLMEQWYERLKAAFPGERVGRIGGGFKDDFSILPIACVAVVNSAVLKADRLLARCAKGTNKSLLIADECHHYIDAPAFGRIRQFPFDYTLGLSATLFPFDVPGLGKIVYEYRFRDACKDGIVPPFDLVNVAVTLTNSERDDYIRLTDEISRQFQLVNSLFDRELQNTPDHFLFARLRQLMSIPGGGDDPTIKRLFMLIFRRSKIVYTAERKLRLAERLIRMLVDQGRKKLVVFFERTLSADVVGEDIARKTAAGLHQSLARGEPI